MSRFLVFSLAIACALAASPLAGFAQQQDFMDKYLPIAQLFDSPVFFRAVVGSAAAFVIISFLFMWYTKRMKQQAFEWGSDKDDKELLQLLESPVSSESHKAYVYLRHNGDDSLEEPLISRLLDQRKNGKINPYIIYLLEDLNAGSAVPALRSISQSKSPHSYAAGQAVARILGEHPEAEGDSKKDKSDSSKS